MERARAASLESRYADAAQLWQAIETEHPGEPEPSFRLAHAYWYLGRVYDARQAIGRGLRRTPANPTGWCRAAELLGLVDGYPQAIELLTKAVEADPASSQAWHLLAIALERVNRLDEAKDAAGRALELNSEDAQARLISARLQRRAGAAQDAAEALDLLLQDPSLEHGLRVTANYEQSAALDACGRYAQAWDACGQAKALLLPSAEPYRHAARRAIKTHAHLAEQITHGDYARWAEQTLDPLPYPLVFVVGHPRSGTTLVEKQLTRHIGALDIDEQPFLDIALGRLFENTNTVQDPVQRLRNATRAELQQVRRAYTAMVSEFAEAGLAGRWVLDKHPEMIRYLPYLARVFPEARVVVVKRDIRDVVLSCYMLPVPLGPVTVDYLEVEVAAKRYRAIDAGYETIKQKLATPPIQVVYESFVAQPQACLEHLAESLGVADTPEPESSDDAAVHARSPSYAAASTTPRTNRIERWRNYPAIALIAPVP